MKIIVISIVTLFFLVAGLFNLYWSLGGKLFKKLSKVFLDLEIDSYLRQIHFFAFLTFIAFAIIILITVGIVPYNGDLYLFKSGSIGIGFTFIARAFGDKNKFGIFKKIKDTEEAKLDSIFVTPICFVFGILIFSLVFLF